VVVNALGVVPRRLRLHRFDSPDRGGVGVIEPAPTYVEPAPM
jgi:hypothetical protein